MGQHATQALQEWQTLAGTYSAAREDRVSVETPLGKENGAGFI
jgi:hypothetical protein